MILGIDDPGVRYWARDTKERVISRSKHKVLNFCLMDRENYRPFYCFIANGIKVFLKNVFTVNYSFSLKHYWTKNLLGLLHHYIFQCHDVEELCVTTQDLDWGNLLLHQLVWLVWSDRCSFLLPSQLITSWKNECNHVFPHGIVKSNEDLLNHFCHLQGN